MMTTTSGSLGSSAERTGTAVIAHFLRSGFLLGLCWLLSLPRQYRDFVDIKIYRRHLHQKVVKEPVELGPNVAVVATWARYPLRHSVQRLLDALQAQGWSVVLVANESPDLDRVLDQWSASADVVIRRANIGRDFGAYQSGYRYVSAHAGFSHLDRLAFFNDSVFYPPNFATVLPELLKKDVAISGFFINHHHQAHAQSFGIRFGPEVATSIEFATFWGSYYPSNLRRHAIQRGEIKLNRTVLNRWPELEAVVTYERLVEADPEVWGNLSPAERQTMLAFVEGDTSRRLEVIRRKEVREAEVDASAREGFARCNTSHAFGLVATRLLAAPFKLDLIKRGSCTPSDFLDVLSQSEVDNEESAELMALLVAGGTQSAGGFLSRQMEASGFG